MEPPTSLEGIVGFSETCKFLGLDESDRETSPSSETPRVLQIIASLLETSISKNDVLSRALSNKKDGLVTIFHGSKAPELGVKCYIDRIFNHSNCSPSCIVVAYMYIQKFTQKQSDFYLTSLNVHRLLITSVMIAAKFLDDTCENNAYYALVGGVSTDEINELEIEFLFSLGFRLQVSVEVFAQFCQNLERKVRSREKRMNRRRGKVEINNATTYEGQLCRIM